MAFWNYWRKLILYMLDLDGEKTILSVIASGTFPSVLSSVFIPSPLHPYFPRTETYRSAEGG
jgi:hypothetical protein